MTQCWADNIFRNTEEGHGDDHGDLVFADQLDSVTVSMTHGTLSPAFMFCTVHKNDRVLRLWRCVYSSIDESVREATACGNNICRIAISTELPRVPSTVSAAAYGFIAVAYADPTVHDGKKKLFFFLLCVPNQFSTFLGAGAGGRSRRNKGDRGHLRLPPRLLQAGACAPMAAARAHGQRRSPQGSQSPRHFKEYGNSVLIFSKQLCLQHPFSLCR